MNLFSLIVCAQMETHVPLKFKSSAVNLFVTPEEALIITTKAGEVAIADSARAYWLTALLNQVINC